MMFSLARFPRPLAALCVGLSLGMLPLPRARAEAPAVPSFRQDVVPVLTKFGCNAGGCHGKLAGQNGFKLSLRGYAPEMDFESLTTDVAGRRIDFAAPEQSLLVAKPAGAVPHEGGKLIDPDSQAYRLLLEWVKARAPGPDAKEADAAALEVVPGSRAIRVGETQQLVVRAHYPDGRVRDVTWLSQFFSNDPSVVSVSRDGLVKSLRNGETGVRVHFQSLVEVVTFTTPFDNTVDPSLFAAKNNVIDEHVFAKLSALHLPPSPGCDDLTFLRRAFLDATGTLPTPEEATAYAADARSDKRARLVDDLLSRPEFSDHWAVQLGDLLQNRKERDHDVRGAKGVRAMHSWLRDQVAKNRPWDQIARDVLTSTGDATVNPPVGYFIVTIGEKDRVEESDVTDSVAQAFLGTRIGCARCHNHPLERYTQDDYYHFAAFFAKVDMKRTEPQKGSTILAIGNREAHERRQEIERSEKELSQAREQSKALTGDGKKQADAREQDLQKRLEEAQKRLEEALAKPATVNQPRTNKPMSAQPLDRAALDFKGPDPRTALADWMTNPKNEAFSGAMVNRLWRHYMGAGLVEPVDDLRSSNPPSNAPLFKALNAEFVSHGYDLRHIMRLILNSRAYQLSGDTLAGNEVDRRYYSHYYARRMPAEVMDDAISAITGVPDSFPGYPVGVRASQLPDPGINSYFLTIFGRSERVTACTCERSSDITLPQLLHLSNGDVQQKVRDGAGRLASLLKDVKDDGQVTRTLFLSCVARPPTEQEQAAVTEALKAGDPREEVFGDLLWALLNSKEFAFNH